ncbi:MAG: hypothetical protein H0W78_08335 [Planctomycetes bacterium]|jgi:hypothetical protein|nr:hypothetical protein [Planctomycetota bacterium]
MPKSQPSFASLAAGVASRLGRLTIQAAQQARTGAAVVARKSLTQVSELLDQAIDATSSDTQAKDATAKSKPAIPATRAVGKSKTRSAKAKRK